MNPAIGYTAITVVALASALIGFYGLRVSRTTSDFYVASRTVRPWWNASAIGGEYLSAASFLGIAGLILLTGSAALWFPIGYTAGYLMLLLFVAAPLRRSGAYTIPDFTEARLESEWARRVTSILVIVVGWFYIVPQLQGAALTVRITTGLPAWVGVAGRRRDRRRRRGGRRHAVDHLRAGVPVLAQAHGARGAGGRPPARGERRRAARAADARRGVPHCGRAPATSTSTAPSR